MQSPKPLPCVRASRSDGVAPRVSERLLQHQTLAPSLTGVLGKVSGETEVLARLSLATIEHMPFQWRSAWGRGPPGVGLHPQQQYLLGTCYGGKFSNPEAPGLGSVCLCFNRPTRGF